MQGSFLPLSLTLTYKGLLLAKMTHSMSPSSQSSYLSEMDLCPGDDSDSLTRNDPLMPEERRYSAAFLEMGPWYQLCFSSELTGVT